MGAPEASDTELIQRCLAGEEAAWETLLTRYERLIYHVALRAGASGDEAADVFQTVCLIWLEQLGNLRNPQSLGAWLVTTTQRECWARWKRNGTSQHDSAESDVEPATSEDSPETLADQAEDARALRSALQRLGKPCQRLLWLLYYDPIHPSYAEIASRLKMPANSVGPTRARCLSKLREILLDPGWMEGTKRRSPDSIKV